MSVLGSGRLWIQGRAGMTGGWDESLSFLGTHRSVTRNFCKCHELSITLWLDSLDQAGYGEMSSGCWGRWLFLISMMNTILKHKGIYSLYLYHMILHAVCSLATNWGLSREGQLRQCLKGWKHRGQWAGQLRCNRSLVSSPRVPYNSFFPDLKNYVSKLKSLTHVHM